VGGAPLLDPPEDEPPEDDEAPPESSLLLQPWTMSAAHTSVATEARREAIVRW
jgi:hypothetical protein